jgi:hypothetical protein
MATLRTTNHNHKRAIRRAVRATPLPIVPTTGKAKP